MTIKLELAPEMESRLRRQAELAGEEIVPYVLKILGAQLPEAEQEPVAERQFSDQQWGDELQAWADDFPSRSHCVDDSREHIYEDRL